MKLTAAEEKEWICTHFDNMMQRGSLDKKNEYILNNPVLLTLNAIPIISEAIGQHPNALNEINYLEDLRATYWEHPEEYPIGYGPIEKIVELLRNGEIQFEEAKQRVKDVKCAGLLSPLYIKVLMLRWIDDLDLDISFTMKSAELAVEAVMAMPLPSSSIHVMMQVTEGYIRLAHGSLLKRPDGQVFTRAINLGKWSVKVANSSNRNALEGAFLHMMGTLSLDAYAANFGPNKEYAKDIDVWIERAVNPMPPPHEGLAIAKIYLEDAIPKREKGSPLGQTQKALLEAIIYESVYTDSPPEIDGLKQLANEATENLDQNYDAGHIQRVNELMGIYI